MFRLQQPDEPVRGWPVKVSIPQSGGHTLTRSFKADFRLLTQDAIDDLVEFGDPAFLDAVCVGWEGVGDEDDQPIAFSREALAKLIAIPYAKRALMAAYFECLGGARVKN